MVRVVKGPAKGRGTKLCKNRGRAALLRNPHPSPTARSQEIPGTCKAPPTLQLLRSSSGSRRRGSDGSRNRRWQQQAEQQRWREAGLRPRESGPWQPGQQRDARRRQVGRRRRRRLKAGRRQQLQVEQRWCPQQQQQRAREHVEGRRRHMRLRRQHWRQVGR
ncbi:Hypothetical predicted protein [Marmota monax]|uniref:Uncharacterized protein n=1 Tax=Marmota monax TaxID=9995 RepID=A0A5E4CT40_MARMO|nr:Hypothetical predicted protein [Marmota monax]